MTKKHRLVGGIIAGKESWTHLANGPETGVVDFDAMYISYPVKFQNGAVYGVHGVMLSYHEEDSERPDQLKAAMTKMGLSLRDMIRNEGGWINEVWFAPAYSDRDNVEKAERACLSLGWERRGRKWYSLEVPDWLTAKEKTNA